MESRIPHGNSPVELRQAFQRLKNKFFDESSDVVHDDTTGFVAAEHVDHSAVSILAGTGLSGGGTLEANRTLALSHLGIEALADPGADRIAFWDESASAFKWLAVDGVTVSITDTTLAVVIGGVDHGGLAGLGDDDHTQYLLADGSRDLTGNLSVDALVTIDGRDLSVDGGKLDGIEAGADQTDATNVEAAGAAMVGGAHHDGFSDFVAAEHVALPALIAAVLTDHNLAAHTGLGLFDQSSDVDHDATTNFVANEHIDHTSVTLTAGCGLSGGGDFSASRTFDLDINELDVAVIAAGDFVPFWDITATATNKKITFANFESALNHDNLTGFVANEHIDHSAVSISSGVGLSGGGTLEATRTLALDIHGLTAASPASASDEFPFWDDTAGTARKITYANLLSGIAGAVDHGGLVGLGDDDHTIYFLADGTRGITGEYTFQPATHEFLFTHNSVSAGGNRSRLAIQAQTAGEQMFLDLFTADGDDSDDVGITVWAMGSPTSTTNSSLLEFRYDSGNTEFAMDTIAGGTGTLRAINIYTQGHRNQLVIATDGSVTMSGDLAVTGNITGPNVSSGADPGHTHTGTSLPVVETLSTSLTAGSVVFSDGSNLSQDNANFFWDDANERLGIGTATPGRSVDVNQTTSVLRLGVWTASSGTSAGYSGWGINFYRSGSGWKYLNSHAQIGAAGIYTQWSASGSSFNFFTMGAGAVVKDASFTPTPSLAIHYTGRVGIATADPDVELEVNGDIHLAKSVLFDDLTADPTPGAGLVAAYQKAGDFMVYDDDDIVSTVKDVYGSMYADHGNETVTVTNAATEYEITAGFTTGVKLQGCTFGGAHYVEVDYAGTYLITWSLSIHTDTNADILGGGFMINGTGNAAGSAHCIAGVLSESQTVSGTAIVSLSAEDEISLYVVNMEDTNDISMQHGSLTVVRIGQ